jgi:hypothetical protein
VLYGALFFILVLFIISIFIVVGFLPDKNERSAEGEIISISYLKYLRGTLWMFEYMLVVAILYLSSNLSFAFMSETLFAKIFLTLFHISFAIAPIIVIVWVAWLIVQIVQDKKLKYLWSRGMFPQGKI